MPPLPDSLYNVVGVVKTHLGLFFESVAESRAVWPFLPDRSSQTLDAADGSRECPIDEAPFFKELRLACRIPFMTLDQGSVPGILR